MIDLLQKPMVNTRGLEARDPGSRQDAGAPRKRLFASITPGKVWNTPVGSGGQSLSTAMGKVSRAVGAAPGVVTGWVERAIDRAIGLVSPAAAYKRKLFRTAARGYDAAGANRLNAGRPFSSKDADSELNGKNRRLRSLTREEGRNSAFVRNARETLSNNVVGDADIEQGVVIEPAVMTDAGELDVKVNKELAALWERYRDCIEKTGSHGFTDMCRLMMNEYFETGEPLAVMHDFSGGVSSDLNFCVELLEADRLPMAFEPYGLGLMMQMSHLENGNYIKHSIEYDSKWRAVAYHIMVDHPGDEWKLAHSYKTMRVPRERVLHWFSSDRAEQTRGASITAAGLEDMADLREMNSAELAACKIQSFFGVHFEGSAPAGIPGQSGYALDAGNKPVVEMSPGMVTAGPSKANFYNGQRPGSTYQQFVNFMVRCFAAAVNMPYSAVSKDYTQLSFSSLRQEEHEGRKSYRVHQGRLLRHFVRPLWKAFVRACVFDGKITSFTADEYFANPHRFERSECQFPRWGYVNPYQEAAADEIGLKNGWKDLSEISVDSNSTVDERLQRMAKQKDLAQRLGLALSWALNKDAQDNTQKSEGGSQKSVTDSQKTAFVAEE